MPEHQLSHLPLMLKPRKGKRIDVQEVKTVLNKFNEDYRKEDKITIDA